MPIYESYCKSCDPGCRFPEEHYYSRSTAPESECEDCGTQRTRLISTFAVVFTGLISTSKYGDPKVEGYNPKVDGHWAWRRRSSVSGKPEPCHITTFQEQAAYCKAEGLANPKDVGPVEIGECGKKVSTRGLPGCW